MIMKRYYAQRFLWIINLLVALYQSFFFLGVSQGLGPIDPSGINITLSYVLIATAVVLFASSAAALMGKRKAGAVTFMRVAATLVALANIALLVDAIVWATSSGNAGVIFVLQLMGWIAWLCLNFVQPKIAQPAEVSRGAF